MPRDKTSCKTNELLDHDRKYKWFVSVENMTGETKRIVVIKGKFVFGKSERLERGCWQKKIMAPVAFVVVVVVVRTGPRLKSRRHIKPISYNQSSPIRIVNW